MNTSIHQGTALITGASSGIGALYAQRLARAGHDLILVARRADKLRDLAAQLTAETGRSVEIVSADLTRADDVARVEAVLRSDASITVLVNNAGIGAVAPLLQSSVDDMERMIQLNVTALTRLTYAVVPGFVARGGGTVINISSIVGIAPEILNGVYGASKAYVLAFTQSLHHELAGQGIRVQAVLPGATATDFWDVAGHSLDNLPESIVMRADAMVDAALAGLAQGEVITIPGLQQGDQWTQYEASRQQLATQLGSSTPAPRYTA